MPQIFLNKKERECIKKLFSKVEPGDQISKRCLVLLKLDENNNKNIDEKQIAFEARCHINTVRDIRKRFLENGRVNILKNSVRSEWVKEIVEILESDPPKGKNRWSSESIAQEIVARKNCTPCSAETVGKYLKKFSIKRKKTMPRIFLNKKERKCIKELLLEIEPGDRISKRCLILLKLDENNNKKINEKQIAFEAKCCLKTVRDIRKHFLENGRVNILKNSVRSEWVEEIVEILKSDPPKGKKQWALKSISQEIVARKNCAPCSSVTVGKYLRKFGIKRKNSIPRVFLNKKERKYIKKLLLEIEPSDRVKKRCLVLLKLDGNSNKKVDEKQIAFEVQYSLDTVQNIRKDFLENGRVNILKTLVHPEWAEEIVEILKSSPQKGKNRWSLESIAQEIVARKTCTPCSAMTVGRYLKKLGITNLSSR